MLSELIVGIPLIGQHLTDSWDRVTDLLEETIGSVLNQSSERYRVVIACNERPEGVIFSHPKLNYVVLPRIEKEKLASDPFADLRAKRHATRRWAAASRGTYFFALDGDDLISRHLVEFVTTCTPQVGFILRQGYALDSLTGRLASIPQPGHEDARFDQHCGSSVIACMNPIATNKARLEQLNRLFRDGHNKAHRHFAEVYGDDPYIVPFKAALYRLNSGGNMSRRIGTGDQVADWIFQRSFDPDEEMRSEFSLQLPAEA